MAKVGVDYVHIDERNPNGKRQVRCLKCGDIVSRSYIGTHQKNPRCEGEFNRKNPKSRGLTAISSHWLQDIIRGMRRSPQGLPPLIEEHRTSVPYRAKLESELRMEMWAPSWLAEIFCHHNLYSELDEKEATAIWTPVIREALESSEARDALLSVYQMSGVDGVKGLGITPKVRASKKRAEAAVLYEKYVRLLREADEIDPLPPALEAET